VVACVLAGLRGLAPLLAFGLGAFAAATAVHHLVVSARRHGWRGLVGGASGGMVVHVGVVVIAVALAASSSYGHRQEFQLRPGETATLAGHRLTYLGSRTEQHANRRSVRADIRVDGGRIFRPALNHFPFATQAIGTPSVRTGALEDVYLTLVSAPREQGDAAVIGVVVQPLVVWLWIGGAIMAAGTVLAAAPRLRRRRTEAPSRVPEPRDEPVAEVVGAAGS
jgi:cytochrome c-type biogenesis protein CcmF